MDREIPFDPALAVEYSLGGGILIDRFHRLGSAGRVPGYERGMALADWVAQAYNRDESLWATEPFIEGQTATNMQAMLEKSYPDLGDRFISQALVMSALVYVAGMTPRTLTADEQDEIAKRGWLACAYAAGRLAERKASDEALARVLPVALAARFNPAHIAAYADGVERAIRAAQIIDANKAAAEQ